MSDSPAPQPPKTPNRPFLDIPKEVTIPGTKVKVPTWLPIAAGVLIVVLLVLWRRRSGGESYEPEITQEEAGADEIPPELPPSIPGGPIEDIPEGLPPVPEQPEPTTVPDLAGYEEPIPAAEADYGAVFPGPSYSGLGYSSGWGELPDIEPGDSGRREIVGQATSNPLKPAPKAISRGTTNTTKQPKAEPDRAAPAPIGKAGVTASVTKQTPLGRVTAGVKKTTAPAPVKAQPKPAPRPVATVTARVISGISKLLGGRR